MKRHWWTRTIDRMAVYAVVWGLGRLYVGGCKPPYYPGCAGCIAAQMVDLVRAILVDEP